MLAIFIPAYDVSRDPPCGAFRRLLDFDTFGGVSIFSRRDRLAFLNLKRQVPGLASWACGLS